MHRDVRPEVQLVPTLRVPRTTVHLPFEARVLGIDELAHLPATVWRRHARNAAIGAQVAVWGSTREIRGDGKDGQRG